MIFFNVTKYLSNDYAHQHDVSGEH